MQLIKNGDGYYTVYALWTGRILPPNYLDELTFMTGIDLAPGEAWKRFTLTDEIELVISSYLVWNAETDELDWQTIMRDKVIEAVNYWLAEDDLPGH